jgi:hypothetical protein
MMLPLKPLLSFAKAEVFVGRAFILADAAATAAAIVGIQTMQQLQRYQFVVSY